MKKTVVSTETQTTKTRKYIVEAPEPKDGQTASSGGIRGENGELTAQYKNPVPYQEPAQPPMILNYTWTHKDEILDQVTDFAISRIGEAGATLWDEWLWPVLKAKIQAHADKTVSSIREQFSRPDAESQSHHMREQSNIINVDPSDLRELNPQNHNEKVIHFPEDCAI